MNSNKDSKSYKDFGEVWSSLPMYSKTKEVLETIYNNQVILVISGTGSGKTVLTPKYTLHVLNYNSEIAITNPKKIPSEENAIFAAQCLDVEIGKKLDLNIEVVEKDHIVKIQNYYIVQMDIY